MKYLYVLLSLLIANFVSVHAQQKYMTVGSGGGVAGTATVYKITPDGKVLKGKGIGEIKYSDHGKIKKARAQKYLQAFSQQLQSISESNYPGNMYFFIGYTENNTERKITWGDGAHALPESIQKLYQEISATLNAARFKPIQ